MEEVDILLERWIINSIVREEVREAIVQMKMEAMDRAYKAGYEFAHDEVRADLDYKTNTNTKG